MQLDRIAVRVVDLNLRATRPDLDLVSEVDAGGPEMPDMLVQVSDVENDPVPGPPENEPELPANDAGKRPARLLLERESELTRIKAIARSVSVTW